MVLNVIKKEREKEKRIPFLARKPQEKCRESKYVLSLSNTLLIHTDPVPRPYILSGGSATPASSCSKASANRL